MNKVKEYIPIMSPKGGELKAIREMNLDFMQHITPLFDVHRIPIANGKNSKTMDVHINKIILNLEKSLAGNFFIIDYSLVDLSLRMSDGSHPYEYMCDKLKEKKMMFEPVIGLERDSAYQEVVKIVSENPDQGVCFRLYRDDLDGVTETKGEIDRILSLLKINHDKCDLVFDLKYIEANDIEGIVDSLAEFNQVINFNVWRSFVLIASGFPQDMSKIPADSCISIRRTEFDLWSAAMEAAPLIGRRPRFGDYCIVNPKRAEIDVAIMRASGKIRYTTTETWEIFRGHAFNKGDKYLQYHSLARKVIESKCFLGDDYSRGDKHINKCANHQTSGPGNLTTWIVVDTNHHLTLVSEQISSFGDF